MALHVPGAPLAYCNTAAKRIIFPAILRSGAVPSPHAGSPCSTLYVVGRLGQHWADLDKPAIPDQAELDQYNKLIGGPVQSPVIRYYEYLPKLSKPLDSKLPSKFAEIITF